MIEAGTPPAGRQDGAASGLTVPYYRDDQITLYHGDSYAVLRALNPRVDHIITDPPYSNETHDKDWRTRDLRENPVPGYQRLSTAHDAIGFAAITDDEITAFLDWASRYCRRWILTFSDFEGVYRWMTGMRAAGLDYVRTCMWDKVDGTPQITGDRPAVGAEAIVCGHQPGRKRWNGGGTRGVFRVATNASGRVGGAKPHPTTKPERLMAELIGLFTDPNELILDPYAGSGSTLVAAKRLGRRAIGIEREEKYCKVAVDRLSQTTLELWNRDGWTTGNLFGEDE